MTSREATVVIECSIVDQLIIIKFKQIIPDVNAIAASSMGNDLRVTKKEQNINCEL